MIARVILIIISWLLLAAHFSRADDTILVIISLAVPLLFIIKKRWSAFLLQVLTLLGSIVWVHTTIKIMKYRIEEGIPYERMAIILISVALFTGFSALMLNSPKIRTRYE